MNHQGHIGGKPSTTAHATGSEKLAGHLAMALFSVLIAGSFALGHKAAPHIGAAAINTLRFALGTAILAGITLVVVPGGLGRPESIWRFIILGALMATYFILMFVALKISDPVSTGAVFTLIPLMSAGFAWVFMHERTRAIVLVASGVGAAGAVWVIFRGDLDAILAFDIGAGEAIFFIGCAAHAAYAPLVRKFRRSEPVAVFTVWTLAATTFWIMLFGAPQLFETEFSELPAVVWAAVLYLAVMATAVTFFLLQFAALRLPASKVLAYGYLTPAFIIVIEGITGNGWVAPSVFAGTAVTAAALLVMGLAPDA